VQASVDPTLRKEREGWGTLIHLIDEGGPPAAVSQLTSVHTDRRLLSAIIMIGATLPTMPTGLSAFIPK